MSPHHNSDLRAKSQIQTHETLETHLEFTLGSVAVAEWMALASRRYLRLHQVSPEPEAVKDR